MKCVVTGGAGFIGSHIVDELLSDGHKVAVIDNLSIGRKSNIADHLEKEEIGFHEIDLLNPDKVKEIFIGQDVIFHLAANANIRDSLRDRWKDTYQNIIATQNVLEAMVSNGIKEIVFSSTSAIYGEAEVMPTPEDYFPVQTSLYGASKLAAEGLTEAYSEAYGIKAWMFRFANVVGERCHRGVIWDFVNKLLEDPRELLILGDGRQKKSFFYVKDCVEGMLQAYKHSKARINIFNLGIDELLTVNKVAKIVIDEMGLKNVKFKYTGSKRGWIGDNPIVHLSIDRLKSMGWEPKVSGEDAVRRTVRWVLKNMNTNS